MVNMLSLRFQQCFGPFTMSVLDFSKAPLKREFLENYHTRFFGVRKFKNTSAMKVIFFFKCSKLNLSFRDVRKNWEKVFCFWDICIWACVNKLSLSRREYLSSAVNVLRNSSNILHITKTGFSQLNCIQSDQ